jgi:chemotaxis protein CheC
MDLRKPIELDELERDALTELVNIGVSRAAVSLRKMVDREVVLTVPSVEIVSRRSAAALIGQRESQTLVAIQQAFHGAFSGRAMLILPESNGLKLVRGILGDETPEANEMQVEDEALAEIGNVIINSCLGSMANMLQQTLKMSLPNVLRGNSSLLFEASEEIAEGSYVLFLYIKFSIRERDIRGYIALIMDLPALERLKTLIGDFIKLVMVEVERR